MSENDPLSVTWRIRLRAGVLRRLRRFFDDHGFLEVQTPLLSREVIPEEHIYPFAVTAGLPHTRPLPHRGGREQGGLELWLQASPEAHMKRLLVELAAEQESTSPPLAIYQVTRSFRAGELGPLHRPEFTIVEWYRTGDDMAAGMDLLDALCREVAGAPAAKRTSYREAFERLAGVEPHTATVEQLRDALARHGISFQSHRRDDLLNVLLVKLIEPNLGHEAPEILYDYPASQASLARLRTCADGVQVAERFELYWRGIELANGFHELADATELRQRFAEVNTFRAAEGRIALPLPDRFLAAMKVGLPPCTGVALGFDRLLMVSAGESRLAVPFSLED